MIERLYTFCAISKKNLLTCALVSLLLLRLIYHVYNDPSYEQLLQRQGIPQPVSGSMQNLRSSVNIAHNRPNIIEKNGPFLSIERPGYHQIKNYTVVGENRFFIYTAHGEQMLRNKRWNLVVFNGWEAIDQSNRKPYICCFKYFNGSIRTLNSSGERLFIFKGPIRAKQILCDIKDNTRPKFAMLVMQTSQCHKNTAIYRIIYTERVDTPKYAINAQIAYGQKNASQIIEFMEYHLYYGANPIIIYQNYDLNVEARKVLQYYVSRGELEVIDYPKVPLLGKKNNIVEFLHKPRNCSLFQAEDQYKRNLGVVTLEMNNDQQVSNFDAHQRLRAYKYFTIMDTDEFIVPGNNIRDFIQLMDDLLKKYKNVAWFRMFSEIHFLDWEQTNTTSRLLFDRYGYHTQPTHLAPKSIYIPERTVPGTTWIHGAQPIEGYKMMNADRDDVVLKHFRFCKNRWINKLHVKRKPKCEDNFQKLRGHFMENIASEIKTNVFKVKHIVGVA